MTIPSDDITPPKFDRGALRTLLGYARPHRTVLLVSLVLTLLASGAGLAQPLVAESVLGTLGTDQNLTGPLLLLSALLLGAALLTGINSWLQQRTSERVVRQVRRRLSFALIRLRVSEFDHRSPGDLIARVTSDSTVLQSAATEGVIMLVNGSLTLAGSFVLMSTLHFGLFAATAVVMIAVAVVMRVVLPRIRLASTRAQVAVGEIGSVLERTLGAIRTVKANGAEARETEAADTAVENAYQAGLTGARYGAAVSVVSGLSVQLTFLVVLGFGGFLVASGALSIASLIAFLLYVFYLSSPISSLTTGLTLLQQGLGASVRVNEVDEMPREEDVDLPVAAPPVAAPRIELREVRFTYPGRAPALGGVSFEVPAGRQTAVVGLSGAGKSTLFALLQRFYEPESGTILVDGTDIATYSRAEVRRRIAYVEQDAPALDGTIGDNLRYAEPAAAPDDIEQVLRTTRLDGLVGRLELGLDTQVGPRGVTLSGGERQRLAIARALLRKPTVLLLDEATAQLDARNEQALREAIDRASEHCTVLVIAHRLSTVTEAEQIVLLENGRVRAAGTHATLVETDDLYRELAITQLLAQEEPAGDVPAAVS
ncbi:ABC transporter ATP-binding protein [Amycolatopsis antarctica]|uniref:ABC transporter ATP-binding protein n=1 Tax=Amycolatopsis antarctica TaxID=1854586 RepID=A0A263D9E5_9PSEU|nr:ABC transporter ATP-binding protein [Amycolatopsis antarctica]OZM75142.1 ABC transporter ATP-binding protein [Amycolatopsis antarctica]